MYSKDDLSVLMYKRTHGDSAVFVVQNEPKGGRYNDSMALLFGIKCICRSTNVFDMFAVV